MGDSRIVASASWNELRGRRIDGASLVAGVNRIVLSVCDDMVDMVGDKGIWGCPGIPCDGDLHRSLPGMAIVRDMDGEDEFHD